jgi:hypothetical protein
MPMTTGRIIAGLSAVLIFFTIVLAQTPLPVVGQGTVPRPPIAHFLGPAIETVQRPEYAITVRVESERPLQRVEIRCGPEVLYQADLTKVEPKGRQYVWQEKARVRLNKGTNRLELVAVNRDGRSPHEENVISYIPPPGFITIDEVMVLSGGAVRQVLKPTYGPNGDVSFPEVPRKLVLLTGRVSWMDPEAKALDDPRLEVVAKVGGRRQLPVALDRRGKGNEANVRRFHVPLVMIGSKNRIRIEVPSVSQRELSPREFDLNCAAPEKRQRLHLLIVGVNVKDGEELKDSVLDALAVDPKDRPRGTQGVFVKKPPFDWCNLYGVVAGDIDRASFEAQLVEINNEIRRLKAAEGWLNDVVLIYYQGEDVVNPHTKERWLKTSLNYQYPKAPVERFAIPCHALPRVAGAVLLLLNVPLSPNSLAAGGRWRGDPDIGFLRYASNDPTALLSLLHEAMIKKSRLGEVVNYVNDLIKREPTKFSATNTVLDEFFVNLRIGGADR